MPVEHNLSGMRPFISDAQAPEMGPAGPVLDDFGAPKLIPVKKLIFLDPASNNTYVVTLTMEGAAEIAGMLMSSSIVVANQMPNMH